MKKIIIASVLVLMTLVPVTVVAKEPCSPVSKRCPRGSVPTQVCKTYKSMWGNTTKCYTYCFSSNPPPRR